MVAEAVFPRRGHESTAKWDYRRHATGQINSYFRELESTSDFIHVADMPSTMKRGERSAPSAGSDRDTYWRRLNVALGAAIRTRCTIPHHAHCRSPCPISESSPSPSPPPPPSHSKKHPRQSPELLSMCQCYACAPRTDDVDDVTDTDSSDDSYVSRRLLNHCKY